MKPDKKWIKLHTEQSKEKDSDMHNDANHPFFVRSRFTQNRDMHLV